MKLNKKKNCDSSFRWNGEGVNEVGVEKDSGIVRVKVNPKYYRPTEVVSVFCSKYCWFV